LLEIAVGPDPVGMVGAVIARPLLLPDPSHDYSSLVPLGQAVDLAMDPDFQAARAAYYDWVRDFFAPLQGHDVVRPLDRASVELARERLGDLLAQERAVVKRDRRARQWRRTTAAFSVIGLGAGAAGAALAGAPAGDIQAVTGILGWVTGHLTLPPADRPPLTGASMFAASEKRLEWLKG
jgi:hypothetical protein